MPRRGGAGRRRRPRPRTRSPCPGPFRCYRHLDGCCISRGFRMVRLTRAQQQERNRAAVLAAARTEFAERGYADAKVDRIAERAELTRGAVYSNFPSKRALYLAVLLDDLSPADASPTDRTLAEALGAFARVWLARVPVS